MRAPTGGGARSSDGRALAGIARLGFVVQLPVILPLVIFLVERDGHPYARHQALQALFFDIVAVVSLTLMWIVVLVLMAVIVGFCLVPAAIVVHLAFWIYALVAAIQCFSGSEVRTPMIAGWADAM